MNNPATQPSNKLNVFTQVIADNPGTPVLLRNGLVAFPIIHLGEDEDNLNKPIAFKTDPIEYMWNLDGTSLTRSAYDMMSFREKEIGLRG